MRNGTGRWLFVLAALWFTGCDSARGPAAPAGPQSFLAGSWQGTVTIQVNADIPPAPPASSAPTTWTFEVVPQTNLQTFRATIHSDHPWLPIDTIATTALSPTNTPPTQISTQGDYSSPRGCRGTFGSFGTADATRIDADFRGADCNLVTFTGHVTLTKR
jgi:hypothetical protein